MQNVASLACIAAEALIYKKKALKKKNHFNFFAIVKNLK